MTAPELSRRDLEEPLKKRIAAKEGRHLIAMHGRTHDGRDDVLDIDGTNVHIVPVRSELDLRRRLLEFSGDEYAVFLVPWQAATLPMDLCGRFKQNGRIETVGRGERLKVLFAVTEVDDSARDSPLADYVLQYHHDAAFSVAGGRLTLDALWTAWLARAWNLDTGGELALDALLGWAAVDGRGPQFVSTIGARAGDAVRTSLLDYLGKRLGPAAPLIWGAWEAGKGAATLELALVVGALANSTDRGVQVWITMTAERVFGRKVEAAALARLGEAADAALRFLARPGRGDATFVRGLVLAADQLATDPAIVDHVAGSPRLPSAWRARLDRFGRALSEVARSPSPTTVQAAVEASRDVWRHDMARDPDQAAVLRRAEMALRLASWLVARSDQDAPPSITPYDDVENLANWYAREGGYVDRARRWARGGGKGPFGDGVQAVVDSADAIRLELDRRFARALPAWHTANRRATHVVPIDQALKRFGTAFLDENPARKLLVILMDGMAWAQAVEILESMGNRASVWGPLAWHGIAKHRVGDGPYPAVLTSFPTLTEVSRSAFFGGKSIPPDGAVDASKDPDRWKANRDVLKHVSGNAVPQLRLRGDGQTKDGSASPDALELVRDPQQRIVGVVINAIDMSLKADRAHEVEWKIETVKALRDLLDLAAEVGRAVLLCSDHGHVPSDLMKGTGVPMREGARWRVWQRADDALEPYEVGIPAGEGVWAPRGAHGVVLLADDAHRHGGGTGSGEHGGGSLAEVVAPCILVGCADVPAASDDADQAVRPAVAPSWWFYDVGDGAPADLPADDRRRKPKRTGKRPADGQTAFSAFEPPPPPEPTPEVPPTPSPLAGSELFKARATDKKAREQALRAVEFLRARRAGVSAAAFAAGLGVFVARVQGVVATLQEILNVDGYPILRYDRQNQQVHLDLEKLAQQFDVTW